MTDDLLGALTFRHPLRRYQRLALAHVDRVLGTDEDDGRFHLVAPPGSGKTILGLELARRFGRPTVVFAPTTAIAQQWRAQVALFLPDGADLDAVVSTDPHRLAPITVLTYQVASTPAGSEPMVRDAARMAWTQELVDVGRAADLKRASTRWWCPWMPAACRRSPSNTLRRRTANGSFGRASRRSGRWWIRAT